jgi:hypothetical protein
MNDDTEENQYIGQVIEADILENVIRIKLISGRKNHPVELVKINKLYVVEGDHHDFYCISFNMTHEKKPVYKEMANTREFNEPIQYDSESSGSLASFMSTFLDLSCLKIIQKEETGVENRTGFVTVPPIFSPVRKATVSDIEKLTTGLYGPEDDASMIGSFYGTTHQYPVNLSALMRVPFGIFGKTHYGKTWTNKMITLKALNDNIQVDGTPVQFIIFDAQGEYGRGIVSRGKRSQGMFHYSDKLVQLTIDPSEARRADTMALYIDPSRLSVDDWINAFWDCTPNMASILDKIEAHRKKKRFPDDLGKYMNYLDENPDEMDEIKSEKFPSSTVNALWRRINHFNKDKFRKGFLSKPPTGHFHVMDNINELLGSGKSVIIHFGQYHLDKDIYMFITNYIARKLYDRYSMTITDKESNLPHLVLLIEEAHRFVPKKGEYRATNAFGKIARETRKFGLVVGLVDQRPSQIDDEVTSQLASRVIHRLDDPDDVKASLSGFKKSKWVPIVGNLGVGEGLWFGDAVGDIPTNIKTFYSNRMQVVKDFLGFTGYVADDSDDADFTTVHEEEVLGVDIDEGTHPVESVVSIGETKDGIVSQRVDDSLPAVAIRIDEEKQLPSTFHDDSSLDETILFGRKRNLINVPTGKISVDDFDLDVDD